MSESLAFRGLINFIRDQYRSKDYIPLHAPSFHGREKEYVNETIESTFVSSVGAFVNRFEDDIAAYTKSPKAVATVNGTAALHTALLLAGVRAGDLVITQALTFVATCNAIAYCGAQPVFVDVDRRTLGLSPAAMEDWLDKNATVDNDGVCRTKCGERVIRACVPMHTFGHPCDLDGLNEICTQWGLSLVEDAAESLGSLYHERHTGTFGLFGTLSFNGNKIITTGGGGMILTGTEMGARAKHLTTTAKQPHPVAFVHDEVGYNYRLPNINAALGCAQLEQLEQLVSAKRSLAAKYTEFLRNSDLTFVAEPVGCRSNFWLNAVICGDESQRDSLLRATAAAGVMTRPVWQPMHLLPMFKECPRDDLTMTQWLAARIVNLPSSAPLDQKP
ncbi:MAG: LegC family aminotransferase [Desulfomicrobium sp.]|nr:LegC family aminotransferase [Pseudomonadota bacterium]MBV1711910.1 LegC family aminotransferase [Desulfomicrobium sp.]MBU4571087.1 LegC family aminotransferase [Pseudomonadota bacterium]MBU4593716.1 LegC family aminotransferase [Pseudomonadota bacterium]MBV1719028.1 LegC family aminotransferase [Desulfomicrobium sp.]